MRCSTDASTFFVWMTMLPPAIGWSWNELLFGVTFLHDEAVKLIATSLHAFETRTCRDWGLTSAASIMMLIPTIILFLAFQRRFIDGLTKGAFKTWRLIAHSEQWASIQTYGSAELP